MPDLLRDFDFGIGKITFIDDELDFSRPLEEQLQSLREDIAQIEYGKAYLLDWVHPIRLGLGKPDDE